MGLKADVVSLGAIGTGAFIAVAATGVFFAVQASASFYEAAECTAFSVSSAPNIAIDLSATQGSGSNRVVIAPRVRVSSDMNCAEIIEVSEIRADEIRLRVGEAREQLEIARDRLEGDRALIEREVEGVRIDLAEGLMGELTAQLRVLGESLEGLEVGEMEIEARRDALQAAVDRLSGNNDEISGRVQDELQKQIDRLNADIERADGNGGTGR